MRPIKPLFSYGPVPTYRMLLCAVLAFGLMFAEHRFSAVETARSHLTSVVAPIQWLVSLPSEGMRWGAMAISDQQSLIDENQRLREQLLTLSNRVQRMASLTAENVHLRELLNAPNPDDVPYITAELLSLDSDPFTQQIVINRGRRDGAYIGQPVMDASGLIGQVVSVSAYTSRVLMVADANHAVPVEINRNGLRFIAQGTGQLDILDVPSVPATADIREGDLLVTSGLGGRFPRGYPVARISDVQRESSQAFMEVTAEPIAQPERSRYFLLLFPPDPPSTDGLDGAEQMARRVVWPGDPANPDVGRISEAGLTAALKIQDVGESP
ncbi:rod shape-determining protein MreC [Salinicola halophilus]|uniref:rod shape-determining protein MreC n=1 Tax=Salinicola halophilus TaxID=184065 RepID=UPI0023B85BCC|nr:rod shape-determining protein MreC [Salinicola halophilus]